MWMSRWRAAPPQEKLSRYLLLSIGSMPPAVVLGAWPVLVGSGERVQALILLLTVQAAAASVAAYRGAQLAASGHPPQPQTLLALGLATVGAVLGGLWAADLRPAQFASTTMLIFLNLVIGLGPVLRWRWHLSGAAGVGALVLLLRVTSQPFAEALPSAFTAAIGVAVLAASVRTCLWALAMLRQVQEVEELRARLAVAEERARFSRDLHDVLGRTLTAVALKSDLAAELAALGAEGATSQMREVQRLAEDSLAEVRSLVSGYRSIDLTKELQGAQSLLRSAGVQPQVVGDVERIPRHAADPLAWVVREAVTNIVRHSSASTATISFEVDDERVGLIVANDGAQPGGERGGRGLVGLRERLASVQGTLKVVEDQDRFKLSVQIPNERGSHDSGTTGR